MNAPRSITIIVRGPNDFAVHEGETYAVRLTWDEMLGEVAQLTHPLINQSRYGQLTPDQAQQRRSYLLRGPSK